MKSRLRASNPGLAELAASEGAVIIAPGLRGRIFCVLNGELIHRFDFGAAAGPAPAEFNNIGGNSLWPAPEGGRERLKHFLQTEYDIDFNLITGGNQ
ncbi:MAG: hypothetical protein PHH77_03985 [Victivallaceae bacterium]|nr:hypothetical protein [Victivallaceae bacterium]